MESHLIAFVSFSLRPLARRLSARLFGRLSGHASHRKTEIELGTQSVVECNEQQVSLQFTNNGASNAKDRRPPKNFAFDFAFWSFDERDAHFANQELVYKELGVPILETSFQGYNGCIFAYGQVI